MDGLLRGDYQSRMNGYATGISNGFLSPNDIHRLENMDLIPADQGGDDYYLNGGYVKLKNAGLAQQNKAAAAQQNQPQQTQPEEETPDSENRQSESTPTTERKESNMKKFWNWIKDSDETRTLRLEGPIDEESFWGDEITPQMFRDELNAGEGDVTVWINSPGGNVFAAAEIYTMLKDYKGSITVKIDAIAASAASVVAMAGDTVQMSPVAMLMIHDPSTIAMGNTKDMEKAIEVLNEVKESIINAYASKSGLSHARIANLMSNETWMNAKKAVELGFADEILFSKKEDEPDSDPVNPDKPEKTPDEEPGEGEEKKPFQQDTAGHLFSSRQMDLIVLNRLGVKPDTPAAQTEPPSDLPAEAGPVLDMDGKTEEGDYSYNVLMKQLECMK